MYSSLSERPGFIRRSLHNRAATQAEQLLVNINGDVSHWSKINRIYILTDCVVTTASENEMCVKHETMRCIHSR